MDLLQNRLREVDAHLASASVSMAGLSVEERKLANKLCGCIELPLGSLLRRADAIRLAGSHDKFSDCLREAAQQLNLRMG